MYIPNFAGFSGQIRLKDVGGQASEPDAACDCSDAEAGPGQRRKLPICGQAIYLMLLIFSIKSKSNL